MTSLNNWVESPEHPGYRIKTIKKGHHTLHILRPILDEKEQAKREAHVKAVAERVLSDYYKRKDRTS